MLKTVPRKSLIVVAGLLFSAAGSSVVMAQDSVISGDNGATVYNSPPSPPGPSYSVFVPVQVTAGQSSASAAVGVGGTTAAAATVQTPSSYHAVGASTGIPGQVCAVAPGTDIPIDCSSQ